MGPEDREASRRSADTADAGSGPDSAILGDLDFRFGEIPEFADTVRAFAAETEDPHWAEATAARIFGEMSHASGLGPDAIQVDCRSTMCRVQLTDARSSRDVRYARFDDLVATFGLPMLWLWTANDDSGVPIHLAYLQRPVLPFTQNLLLGE